MEFLKYIIKITKAFFSKELSYENPTPPEEREEKVYTEVQGIQIEKDFITLNKYSRPGLKRKGVKAIEVHWVANPNATARQTRNWFQMLKSGKYGYASTQFAVGLDGEIIQMIPEDEIAYSSGARAKDFKPGIIDRFGVRPYYWTISIECQHIDWAGKMNAETVKSLMNLCVHLCEKYNLTAKDILLHYDITGKICHKWYVTNPKEWDAFKDIIDGMLLRRRKK